MRKLKAQYPIIEIGLILIIVSLLINNMSLNKKITVLEEDIHTKTEKQVKIQREITSLEEEIAESNTLKYIEKKAREEHGMVKPKEVVFKDLELQKDDN